ncbi:MAG TPA: DUF1328 domain-containing protein [Planctomycetota bacterium]|nr:DUF1328 domain-containing protein [Planctomycetota bacterium]
MLNGSVMFFAIAVLAALFGFTGIAGGAAWVAQVLFYLFVIAFSISLIRELVRDRRFPPGD